MRTLLLKFHTMQVNQLRGLLYEFGATCRAGRVTGLAEIRARMAELESQLPGAMLSCLQEQVARIDGLQQDVDRLGARTAAWQKQDAPCRAIADVPGIGKLNATTLVATMVDAFKRSFAVDRKILVATVWCLPPCLDSAANGTAPGAVGRDIPVSLLVQAAASRVA